MEYAFILFRQLVIMFIYMMIGFVLYKRGLLDKNNTQALSNLLIYVVIPSVIINTFCIPYSKEGLAILGQGSVAALVSLGSGAIICILAFKKDLLTRVGATFPNAGFIGIPLVSAALGQAALLYLMPYQMLVSVFQYTYASFILSREKDSTFKMLLKNPMLISILIGLLLFFCHLGDKIPSTVSSVLSGLSNLQSPLAMMISGTYLAQIDFKRLNVKADLYASAIRLLIIPVSAFLLLKLIDVNYTARLVALIASSCSIGSNIAVYAERFGGDHVYACEVVTFSTILSIITLPLLMMILI